MAKIHLDKLNSVIDVHQSVPVESLLYDLLYDLDFWLRIKKNLLSASIMWFRK